ncbi:MAG: hypothetical protein RLZZ308_553 [Candidatus Parcubacteria bacterium]
MFDPTHLYYELEWLDIPMHVLGGVGVASLVLSVVLYKHKKVSLLGVVVMYTVVAVMWELYEYVKDLLDMRVWNGWVDTGADYINGAVGAIIAYIFAKKS